MTQTSSQKLQRVNHIGKQKLLELLSKKLGCSSEEVGFLFQCKEKTSAPEELTIPDARVLP